MARSFRKFAWKKGTKASIGIGTLIVFIALVLTAAIASAVILKTAYSLKDRAERQGSMAAAEVAGGVKVLDITGDRGNPVTANIVKVRFLATVWAGDANGVNIAKLRIHWKGPTQSVYLNLNPASHTVASSTDFAAEEIPVRNPRSPEWDPNAVPPTYFLVNENVIYIEIDLTALNGINDPLGAGDTASIYFIPGQGLTVEETFTTPNSYGNNEFIDLTML
jgi:archaellin